MTGRYQRTGAHGPGPILTKAIREAAKRERPRCRCGHDAGSHARVVGHCCARTPRSGVCRCKRYEPTPRALPALGPLDVTSVEHAADPLLLSACPSGRVEIYRVRAGAMPVLIAALSLPDSRKLARAVLARLDRRRQRP